MRNEKTQNEKLNTKKKLNSRKLTTLVIVGGNGCMFRMKMSNVVSEWNGMERFEMIVEKDNFGMQWTRVLNELSFITKTFPAKSNQRIFGYCRYCHNNYHCFK